MDGIVSVLEDKYYQLVLAIWQDLREACGFQNNESLTVPHFSWHVAQSYPDETRLGSLLEEISLYIKPFQVRTSGIGIFFQPRSVIYIPIVKTPELIRIHQLLWEQLADLADQPIDYYAPDYWIPHITLVYDDLTISGLTCALMQLSERISDWEIEVNNFALIGQTTSKPGGICIQHSLRGTL